MSNETKTTQVETTTMPAADTSINGTPKVIVEYGKETLKLLDAELMRLHEVVIKDPKNPPQWAIDQIQTILKAITSGTPIHSIPPIKQTKS